MLRRKKTIGPRERKRPIEHTGFYPYLRHYLEATAIKGYSQDTRDRHDSHIRRFAAWAAERGLDAPNQVTKPILERYRKHLYYSRKTNGEPLSFSSQQVMLSSLKSFFRWLAQENHLLYNPASELQLPKPPKQLPRTILSQEDIATILQQPDLDTPNGLRDRVIMECFYGTGLRRTELAKLKDYDVDLKRRVLVVREGKGNKDRVLPLGERLADWLRRYTENCRDQLRGPADDERLFITDYGEPFTGGLLGTLVKRYLRAAGIDVVGSCHLFRHAMATHMLENGADIRFIQVMLGHEEITSTAIYTRVSVEKLRDIHTATHPTARRRQDKGDPA
nr:tyrosine recombinase XerC 2-like [Nerophis lumbriciformis]